MSTKIVGPQVKFKNIFTKFGREKNHLYKEMKKAGFAEIRERNLPNGSTVALGYKGSKGTNDIAFLLRPDLSLEEKAVKNSVGLTPWKQKTSVIDKFYADKNGEVVRHKTKKVVRINDSVIASEIVDNQPNKLSTTKASSKYGGVKPKTVECDIPAKDIAKFTEKTKDNFQYCVLENLDGSKTYIKSINGQNYTFQTR